MKDLMNETTLSLWTVNVHAPLLFEALQEQSGAHHTMGDPIDSDGNFFRITMNFDEEASQWKCLWQLDHEGHRGQYEDGHFVRFMAVEDHYQVAANTREDAIDHVYKNIIPYDRRFFLTDKSVVENTLLAWSEDVLIYDEQLFVTEITTDGLPPNANASILYNAAYHVFASVPPSEVLLHYSEEAFKAWDFNQEATVSLYRLADTAFIIRTAQRGRYIEVGISSDLNGEPEISHCRVIFPEGSKTAAGNIIQEINEKSGRAYVHTSYSRSVIDCDALHVQPTSTIERTIARRQRV